MYTPLCSSLVHAAALYSTSVVDLDYGALIRIIFSAVGRLISLSVDETHKLAFTPPCPPKSTPCTLQQSSPTPGSTDTW